MSKQPVGFIHSMCCMAHWELVVFEDGTADLVCEKCGMSSGSQVEVVVNMEDMGRCACCEDEPDPERN